MQDITAFLRHNGVEDETQRQLSEVLIELVGNAGEHGKSDCLIDIDITKDLCKKTDENDKYNYYGMNTVIMNFSNTLFPDTLKTKLTSQNPLNDRYNNVRNAFEYHKSQFNKNYTEDDFYTISSFQHKISGSEKKNNLGEVGLTTLIKSLVEKSYDHLCYMLSGNRILFFKKEHMVYDENNYIGFNENKSYFNNIPNTEVLNYSKTFMPGVAYNLSFIIEIEKGWPGKHE